MQSNKTSQWMLSTGAIFALSAVLIGAFGAHGLKQVLDSYALGLIETAAKYQMYHAIALLIMGVMTNLAQFANSRLNWVGSFFTLGVILFSGSLYLLAFSQAKWLGAVTPVGGLALMLGWLMLIITTYKGTASIKPE